MDVRKKVDYEFEAFKKGFNEGLLTIWGVFNITKKELQEKLPLDLLNSSIYDLYQIWQNTIKDKKIIREESILSKKFKERINEFKKSIIDYIALFNKGA